MLPDNLPSTFQPLASILPDDFSVFQTFYRERLKRSLGERIKSTQLRQAYHRWAEGAGAPSLSFNAIKRFMSVNGHRARRTDGIFYLDVRFIPEVRPVERSDPDPLPLFRYISPICLPRDRSLPAAVATMHSGGQEQ